MAQSEFQYLEVIGINGFAKVLVRFLSNLTAKGCYFFLPLFNDLLEWSRKFYFRNQVRGNRGHDTFFWKAKKMILLTVIIKTNSFHLYICYPNIGFQASFGYRTPYKILIALFFQVYLYQSSPH